MGEAVGRPLSAYICTTFCAFAILNQSLDTAQPQKKFPHKAPLTKGRIKGDLLSASKVALKEGKYFAKLPSVSSFCSQAKFNVSSDVTEN